MPQEHDCIMREIMGQGDSPDYSSEYQELERLRKRLTVQQLQTLSKQRADRWHNGDNWTLLEWAGAMCGEAGEAANVAKKIRRIDGEMKSQTLTTGADYKLTYDDRAGLLIKLAEEAVDTILYAVCLLNELDFDAEDLLREVFNKKSEQYGFPEKL